MKSRNELRSFLEMNPNEVQRERNTELAARKSFPIIEDGSLR